MLVLQRRTLDRLRIESGHAALDVGAQPRERLVDRRLVLGAEPDGVLAPVRHGGGVHHLAVRARPVLEAGEPRARLAHSERRACVELDLERDVEAELLAERMHLRTGADDRAVGRPEALRGAEQNAVRLLGKLEHLRTNDPVAESLGKSIDRRAHVDRPAELVEQRLILGRRHDGQRLDLPVPINPPRRHPGRLEGSRPLRNVRPADEHTLAPEQPNPELLLEPLPLGPRPHSEPNEPLIVMTMPKHPGPPSRLPRTRSSGLEQPHIDTAPSQRIGSRQPTDPSTDDGDLGARNGHASTVRLSTSAR